ncbi:MAG: tetratricopeptide (TPR) repeat protein [Myxococcota bacterium]|jgi:tetratricopeptide (TPR) repeat protein
MASMLYFTLPPIRALLIAIAITALVTSAHADLSTQNETPSKTTLTDSGGEPPSTPALDTPNGDSNEASPPLDGSLTPPNKQALPTPATNDLAREMFGPETPGLLTEPTLRQERVARHHPAPVATSHQSFVPPIFRVKAQRVRGIFLEAIGDDEGARLAFETCIGLGDSSIDNWQRLGRARLHSGLFDAAEGAFLAAFQLSSAHRSEDIEGRSQILEHIGELYILTRHFGNARMVLDEALALTPNRSRINHLIARVESKVDTNFDTRKQMIEPLWPVTRAQAARAYIEDGLHYGFDALPAPLQLPLAQMGTFAASPRGRELGLALVCGLTVVFALLRRLRGHGGVVIAIEYPRELRGSFTVHIADQAGQFKRAKSGDTATVRGRESRSSTTLHLNVGRETQFQRLLPKVYYVAVDGVLMDPDTGEVLLRPFDEYSIEVRKGETMRLEFDMQPRECPVDVQVLWDKQPTEDAGVAARGLPSSLRYTKDGSARLRLCMGNHTIVVGSGDRVAEREIDVQSFSPTTVAIDLAGSEGVVFKGCPPAVKPYLHGDHNAAARALSRDGHTRIANVLLARLHRDLGQSARAADYFKAAGQHLEAAELKATLEDYAGAALLFEDAGQLDRAAEMYRSANDWQKAGDAFESLNNFRAAADCFRQAEELGRWLGALESNGDYFEAAQLALEHSDRARAIRLFQLVPLDSPHYSNACELLADAFEHEGHADLAVQKIEQRIAAGDGSPDLYSRLATLLEASSEWQRALDVLESLRDDEPTYPNIAARIESLRKRVTAQSLSQSAGSRSNPNTAAPTAFLAEKRYEVLEELGRGGMGVVYKAKDLRLNREVALKRLPENLRDHPKAIQLFMREAQACARLNHRNIVTIFDTDQDDTNFFITMELLQGYPLNVIRKKRGRLAVRDAARLGVQVSEGLHYAHSQGIVHRDIKTANLFFTTDKVVKIMDFGLAKMMEEVRRGTTVLGGTPYYMSPEQAQGGAVDQRADIYSFGVTLYELVTGGVPFADGDVAYHHRHTPLTDPRERAPDIGDDIAELILHMMEKNPQQRCASAEEVRHRLEAIANAPG